MSLNAIDFEVSFKEEIPESYEGNASIKAKTADDAERRRGFDSSVRLAVTVAYIPPLDLVRCDGAGDDRGVFACCEQTILNRLELNSQVQVGTADPVGRSSDLCDFVIL